MYEYENPFSPPAPPPKKPKRWAIPAIALCCALLGGAVGAGGVLLGSLALQQSESIVGNVSPLPETGSSTMVQGQRENTVLDIVYVDTSKQMTAAEVYAANVHATVGITTSITTNYWGYPSTSAASGSGFILTDDGYILTNFHVVEDADSITVSMYNGESYEAALIGYDESNDIAVLKVQAQGLSTVVLGDSDNLNVGDEVVAIGNPLGELTFSLTAGMVSAKDREVTFSSGVTMTLLQTDCAINSGNSGGALFNLYGEVIGVTNAKYSSSGSEASIDNIGFAIPINSVRDIVTSIIENGYVSKPYLGISIQDVSAETQKYGIPAGAAVQAVVEDGPAAQAGLQAGDVITAVDGAAVTASSLKKLVESSQTGDTYIFTVYRKGETLELTVTIGQQIQSALAQEEENQQTSSGNAPWGPGRN